MGAVGIDLEKNFRQHETKYALDTPDGVKMLLEDMTALEERRYIEGDYDACVILIDLKEAIHLAKLTEKQYKAMMLYYVEGYNSYETSELIDMKYNNGIQYAEKAVEKIARVYKNWNYYEIS